MSCLRISTDLGELRRMSEWLRAAADAASLAPTDTHSLELCANEAIANIVQHGSPSERAMPIELTFCADDRSFALKVEDHAGHFDPVSARLPDLPDSLDAAGIGGLGLVLIQRLLPGSDYQREGDRNVLVLRGARSRST